jgi:hypothetical protein
MYITYSSNGGVGYIWADNPDNTQKPTQRLPTLYCIKPIIIDVD